MKQVAFLVILFCVVAAAAVTGCDRPFVEISEPEIEVVEPDLSEVLGVTTIQVKVRATSFRAIDRVLLQGAPMEYDSESGLWTATADLSSGLNDLVVTAFDVENVARQDTAIVVVFSPQFSVGGPPLPRGVGDHAAILTADGDMLVTGGSYRPDGEAWGVAFLSSPAGAPFVELGSTLRHPRLGHTMTLMPDGRILIVGGARRGIVNDVLTLVQNVEIFDPATREFRDVPVDGDPIRRVHHTASGEASPSGFILDLYGGRGDIEYRPESRIGIRQDIRSFLFRNDSLIAFTLAPGPFLGEPISGHTQTPTLALKAFLPTEYLYSGTDFGQNFQSSVSFTVDFRDPLGLIARDTGKTIEPRTHHASVAIEDGLVLTLGGCGASRESPIGSVELYVAKERRFLRVPLGPAGPLRRSGHSATKLPDGRIMITGGFLAGGNSTSLTEYLSIPTN